MKRAATHRREIFSNHNANSKLISRLYKELSKLSKEQPNQKGRKDLNGHLAKEDIQVENKYMKKYTISLVFREMQIKPTMRYYCIPIRVAKTKAKQTSKQRKKPRQQHMWRKMQANWNIHALLNVKWQSFCTTVQQFPTKLNIYLSYDQEILFLGISDETKIHFNTKP